VQQVRGARHPAGYLCEQIVELAVAGDELQRWTPGRISVK
jgi:hypothetical protein